MGIDPVTHKAKSDALSSVDGESKNTASLSHMAQWESARLEAEARLVKESKLRSLSIQHQLGVPAASAQASTSSHSKAAAPPASSLSLDVLKAWQEVWSKSTNSGPFSGVGGGGGADLESPTSTLKFSEKPQLITSSTTAGFCYDSTAFEGEINGEGEGDWKSFERSSSNLPTLKDRTDNATIFTTAGLHDAVFGGDGQWTSESLTTGQEPDSNFLHGFGDLILGKSGDRNSSEGVGDSDNGDGSHLDDLEESRIYWSDILNLVNSSPSDAPVF